MITAGNDFRRGFKAERHVQSAIAVDSDRQGPGFTAIQCDGKQKVPVVYRPGPERPLISGNQCLCSIIPRLPECDFVQQRVVEFQIPGGPLSA